MPLDRPYDAERPPRVRSELRVIFASTPLAVRDALLSTLGGLRHLDLDEDAAGTVELVLAEVMNNVVEHAYAGDREGMIELQVTHDRTGLYCAVMDDGLPMPDGNPPLGDIPEPDPADPPEGGFGWFLIRALASDLTYSQKGGRNHLTFRLPIDCSIRTS